MLKLYKEIAGVLHYWETWDVSKTSGIIHFGIVGQTGIDKTINSGEYTNFKTLIQLEIDKKMDDGFKEFDDDDYIMLEIDFPITKNNKNRRLIKDKVKSILNEALGWHGVGHFDSETFEKDKIKIYCVVVDFVIAEKVISESLKNTEFSNYSKISSICGS